MDDKAITPDKAVALRYDKAHAGAPRVIAGGRGLLAEKIIEIARETNIHIQEDPDLVELLAKIPIGEEIPVELYQSIAEVLAFVYQLNDTYKEQYNRKQKGSPTVKKNQPPTGKKTGDT